MKADIDAQAEREGAAISRAFVSKRPRTPGGLPKEYRVNHSKLAYLNRVLPVVPRRDDNAIKRGEDLLKQLGLGKAGG